MKRSLYIELNEKLLDKRVGQGPVIECVGKPLRVLDVPTLNWI